MGGGNLLTWGATLQVMIWDWFYGADKKCAAGTGDKLGTVDDYDKLGNGYDDCNYDDEDCKDDYDDYDEDDDDYKDDDDDCNDV